MDIGMVDYKHNDDSPSIKAVDILIGGYKKTGKLGYLFAADDLLSGLEKRGGNNSSQREELKGFYEQAAKRSLAKRSMFPP
jgi:hypothetical protein